MKSSHYSHYDEHCPTVMPRDFWGLALSVSRRPPSAMSRPGLDCHRSTKEPRPYIDHRESHVLYSAQDVSPSRHQHHHDAPGMACMHQGTSLQQHLQRPSRLLLQGTPRVFCRPRPSSLVYKRGGQRTLRGDTQTTSRSTFQAIIHFPLLRLGPTPSLVSCNPYTSISVQGNTILSLPAGRRAFFARTRINLRVFSLHHHPD
jgi:hypothetical protein